MSRSPDHVLDHPLIAQRYFFPTRASLKGATLVQTPVGHLSCWRSAPAGSGKPVLVHFHGNGELVHHWIEEFGYLAHEAGYALFLAEYRGYGSSDGEPLMGRMLDEDVAAIAAAVGEPSERVVVMGRSVGSIFALEWVRRFPHTAGLVLESGIHDVFERLALRVLPQEVGLTREEFMQQVQQRCDHQAVLERYPGPSLILHAQHDDLVDISHARRNAAAAGTRAHLVELPKGDHNSILVANSARYTTELKHFLERANHQGE